MIGALKLAAIAAYATVMASDQAPNAATTFRVERAAVQLQGNRYSLDATLEIPSGYQVRVLLGVDPNVGRGQGRRIKFPNAINLPFGFRTGRSVPANHSDPTGTIEFSLKLTPTSAQCSIIGPSGKGSTSSQGGSSSALVENLLEQRIKPRFKVGQYPVGRDIVMFTIDDQPCILTVSKTQVDVWANVAARPHIERFQSLDPAKQAEFLETMDRVQSKILKQIPAERRAEFIEQQERLRNAWTEALPQKSNDPS